MLSEHRLLTITGLPGIGKTRIAIELPRRFQDLYDETWFVDLLSVRGGNFVASQIALRLNLLTEGDDGLSGIVHRIRSRKVLSRELATGSHPTRPRAESHRWATVF